MRERWRCYVGPCDGAWRTDGSWRDHWEALHRADAAMAVERPRGTDVLPWVQAEPIRAGSGRAAFEAERARRRQAETQ